MSVSLDSLRYYAKSVFLLSGGVYFVLCIDSEGSKKLIESSYI